MVTSRATLVPREAKTSIDDLVAGATDRELWKTADSLSGSALERLVIDGDRYVLKHLHVDDDWIMRAQGDLYSRPLIMWMSGLFDALPDCFDHTIVGVASNLGRNGWGCAVLMRDVSPYMVRVADGLIPLDQHLRFLDHMAQLHVHFRGFSDEIGLMAMGSRFYSLTPLMANYEIAHGNPDPVPSMVPGEWARMADESPMVGKMVLPLLEDPSPLCAALEAGPQTLIHSDWKAGNLGSHPDGRTILIDWAFPGEAPGSLDLGWYLAVNCDLLPQSKEDAIAAYGDALERHGVSTNDAWWEPQLELGLLGAFVMVGWSKTGDELAWWEERLARAVKYLSV
jgi:hypothetical protein